MIVTFYCKFNKDKVEQIVARAKTKQPKKIKIQTRTNLEPMCSTIKTTIQKKIDKRE